jgi:hypothetical protein
MSLIVRTFTADGFVIAADGRESDAKDPSDRIDTAQKVFHAKSLCGSFALSISGAVSIVADDGRGYAVEILDQAVKSAESLQYRRTGDLLGYAHRLVRPVHAAMKEAVDSGKLACYPTLPGHASGERGSTLSLIMLDGYHNASRSSVNIRLFHEDGLLAEPEIDSDKLDTDVHYANASDAIGLLLFESNDEVDNYLKSLPAETTRSIAQQIIDTYRPQRMYINDVMTIEKAIDRSKRYIEACSDPVAIALSEEYARIGGRIHIATVTPNEGFQWVPGYEPATPTNRPEI